MLAVPLLLIARLAVGDTLSAAEYERARDYLPFTLVDSADATAGELQFTPGKAQAGEEVRVEYRAATKFAGEDRLVLRARLFRDEPELAPHHTPVADLIRTDSGVFRGSFHVPSSAVYMAFSVEDRAGRRVAYDATAWDLLVHDSSGRPLLLALQHQIHHLGQADSRLAEVPVQEMVRLYPHHPAAWLERLQAELNAAGMGGKDSVRVRHQPRVREMEQRVLRDGDPDPKLVADLIYYASAVQDSAVANRWRDWLIASHPTHPEGVRQRVFAASRMYREDTHALLEFLDGLWAEGGGAHVQLVFSGFMSAQRVGNPEAIRRWGERLDRIHPVARHVVTQAFVKRPELREQALVRLRRELASLDGELIETERPLMQDVETVRRGYERLRGRYLGELGKALIAEGHTRAALDTLQRAVEAAWNVELFRNIAEAKLSLGDTVGAVPVLARVAADPETSPLFSDSVRMRVDRAFEDSAWDAAVEAGRGEMEIRLWATSVDRPIEDDLRLARAPGGPEPWPVTSDGPTVVAFWSRYCTPSHVQLKAFERAYQALRAQGIRVVGITRDPLSAEVDKYVQEEGLTFPILHDVERTAERAFDNTVTPRYFVLDASGRVRFDNYSPDDLVRQAVVLKGAR